MHTKIFFCENCRIYTLEKLCPKCNSKTENPKPIKYSPEDKYGKYRRLAKTI